MKYFYKITNLDTGVSVLSDSCTKECALRQIEICKKTYTIGNMKIELVEPTEELEAEIQELVTEINEIHCNPYNRNTEGGIFLLTPEASKKVDKLCDRIYNLRGGQKKWGGGLEPLQRKLH